MNTRQPVDAYSLLYLWMDSEEGHGAPRTDDDNRREIYQDGNGKMSDQTNW